LRNPFSPFFLPFFLFVTSRDIDILQKKARSSIFFRARVCTSQVICTVCYKQLHKQLQHLLFSSRPHFTRQPTGIKKLASAAESIPYLEGGSARTKSWVGLAGVSA
jgi:hypothetical protein